LKRNDVLRAWYEELRKTRVAELKRSLELSEDSIGLVAIFSLQAEDFATRDNKVFILKCHKSQFL